MDFKGCFGTSSCFRKLRWRAPCEKRGGLGMPVGGGQVFGVTGCSWELKLVVFWDLTAGIWVSDGCRPWLFSTLLWWISSLSYRVYSPSLFSIHKGLNKTAQGFPTPVSFLSLVLMPLKTQGLSFWPCSWGCTSLYITYGFFPKWDPPQSCFQKLNLI